MGDGGVIQIRPSKGRQKINLPELVAYKDLLYFLVRRDVKALYAQTVIGFGWAVLRPLFAMVVFSVIFGGLAGVPSDGVPYPLFAFAALVPWTYFATAMTGATASLVSNSNLLSKVYFPRLIIPLTPLIAGLVDFGIALAVLGMLMLIFGIPPTAAIVFLPVLILVMMVTAFGAGLWLSSLAIQYRDVRHAVPYLIQLLMFAAPVVWPVSLIAEKFPESHHMVRLAYGLYPMAGVIEGFRACLLGTTPMPWDLIAAGAVSASGVAVTGSLYFRRAERVFADVA